MTAIITRVEDLSAAIGWDVGSLERQTAGLLSGYTSLSRLVQRLIAVQPGASATAAAQAVTAVAARASSAWLADLPEPQLIEEIDYEAILARRKSSLRTAIAAELAKADAAGRTDTVAALTSLGEFLDVEGATETILLEEAAYAEMLLRSRINQVYRARLLYFAAGADLDHVAEDSGIARLAGEKDPDLRDRVRIKNRGSSAAGPDDWWRYHAMAADEGVEAVAVSRPDYPFPAPGQKRGALVLSVLAQTADGVASDVMLDRVRAVVTSPAVRGATTEVTVRAAAIRVVDVTAAVWLYPDADPAVIGTLDARLRAAWARSRRIGWNPSRSWLEAALQADTVQRVELTAFAPPPIAADEAPRLGTIAISFAGTAT